MVAMLARSGIILTMETRYIKEAKKMEAPVCHCAICGKTIHVTDAAADHFVYDMEGDLDYIELAHADCAELENEARGFAYWEGV